MIFQKVKNYCREKDLSISAFEKCVTSEMALWLGGKMTNLNPLWQHWKNRKSHRNPSKYLDRKKLK